MLYIAMEFVTGRDLSKFFVFRLVIGDGVKGIICLSICKIVK